MKPIRQAIAAAAALVGVTVAQAQQAPQRQVDTSCPATVSVLFSRVTGIPEFLGGDPQEMIWPGIEPHAINVTMPCQRGVSSVPLLDGTYNRTTGFQFLTGLLRGESFISPLARHAFQNLLAITGDRSASIEGSRPLMRCTVRDGQNNAYHLVITTRDQAVARQHIGLLGYRLGRCYNLD